MFLVLINDTYDKNFGIKNFSKYLKESCWKYSDEHFSLKYFPNHAFTWKISP